MISEITSYIGTVILIFITAVICSMIIKEISRIFAKDMKISLKPDEDVKLITDSLTLRKDAPPLDLTKDELQIIDEWYRFYFKNLGALNTNHNLLANRINLYLRESQKVPIENDLEDSE